MSCDYCHGTGELAGLLPCPKCSKARARWLKEWLRHLNEAKRFGSADPVAIADALAGPAPPRGEREGRQQ